MTKANFKKRLKEYLEETHGRAAGKIIDIDIWSNEYTDYMFTLMTIQHHTVCKYHGWLNDDETIEMKYVGCL